MARCNPHAPCFCCWYLHLDRHGHCAATTEAERCQSPPTTAPTPIAAVMKPNPLASGRRHRFSAAARPISTGDPRAGAVVTNNFADYHIPVCADIGDIDVLFVDEPDLAFNPLGARGIGEIGITGVAAAIANAVWHATGVRVRDLPIVPEKLLGRSA